MTADAGAGHAHVIERAGRHGPGFVMRIMASITGCRRGDVCLRTACCVHAVVTCPAFLRRPDKHVVVVTTIAGKHGVRADQRKAGGKVVEGFAVGKDAIGQRQ